MKTKIVLWGSNEKDEKILLGIELVEKDNNVLIYVFPEAIAKEDFYNQLLNDWRSNNPVVFPDGHEVIKRPLSITDSLLPDEIKVTRTDVVNRAKAEWHFVVLSSKLYQLYKSEIADFKDKIEKSESFDKNLWEELKAFWKKVQEQVYDKNLFREHANELHNETNSLFDQLKEFRKKLDNEFQKESKEKAKAFQKTLEDLEKKINEGFGLQPLWNEMKKIQTNFRSENMGKSDRNEIWNKIDKLFKVIKEKKYGSQDSKGRNNAQERLENRYKGLLSAIKKMENSIKWDKKDLNFQGERIEETYGQLEREIRKAKLLMVKERINSKEIKLAEMHQTRTMLEQKIEKEKQKAKKAEEAKKVKKVESELKQKIKEEIKEKNKILDEKMGAASEADTKAKAKTDAEVKPETDSKLKKEAPKEAKPVSEVEVKKEVKNVTKEDPNPESNSKPDEKLKVEAKQKAEPKEKVEKDDEAEATVKTESKRENDISTSVKASKKTPPDSEEE